ncbi:13509_t:CDS:2, partial [Acaulospora colombiana]
RNYSYGEEADFENLRSPIIMPAEITTGTSSPSQTVQNKGKGRTPEEEKLSTKQVANEYQLKAIEWIDPSLGEIRRLKVITQNENGPCPLLALWLIEIKPYDRPSVTYDYLVELLGDYLLKTIPFGEAEIQKGLQELTIGKSSPKGQEQQELSGESISRNDNGLDRKQIDVENKNEKDIATSNQISTRPSLQDYHHTLNTALSIIPSLQTGLDVNVRFNSIHGFEPTAELSVFDVFNVELVHGWVVDPQDQDTWDVVVGKCGSYNKAVECVVGGDSSTVPESSEKKSDENSEGDASAVERIRDDVDQNASEFVDGKFRKCEATGGDYVNVDEHEVHGGGDQDYALALSLQQEENDREEEYRRKKQQQRQREQEMQQPPQKHNDNINTHLSPSQLQNDATSQVSGKYQIYGDQ